MIQKKDEISFAEVQRIVAQYTDVDVNQIQPESELLCDLGLTSFDLVCLASSLESEFGLQADEKMMKNVKTVAVVYNLAGSCRKPN